MLLDVQDVHKAYPTEEGDLAVLRGVSFQLGTGQSLALTGESGSGKSTLLHLVGGLDQPDAGRILVDGDDIAALDDNRRAAVRRGTVGLAFQQFNLIPSLTVAQNLAFQARLAGRHDADWTRTPPWRSSGRPSHWTIPNSRIASPSGRTSTTGSAARQSRRQAAYRSCLRTPSRCTPLGRRRKRLRPCQRTHPHQRLRLGLQVQSDATVTVDHTSVGLAQDLARSSGGDPQVADIV